MADQNQDGTPEATNADSNEYQEPKLDFVTPKLVKHGTVEKITAGFFGSFYP